VRFRRAAFERPGTPGFLALLSARARRARRLTRPRARPPQRGAAERVMLQLQEHQDMWTRVDAILETSSNPNSKFLALQARARPSPRQWAAVPPRHTALARGAGPHAAIAGAACAERASHTRLIAALRQRPRLSRRARSLRALRSARRHAPSRRGGLGKGAALQAPSSLNPG